MATKIKRGAVSDAPDARSIRQWVSELVQAKAQQKALKSRQDQVTKRLKAHIEETGYQDDQGHIWLDLDEPVDGCVALQMQRKVGQTLNEEKAEEILKAKGIYDQCTTTITVVDQEKVYAALYDGTLTEDDAEAMFPKVVSYALMTPTSK